MDDMDGFILFSHRDAITRAIMDPGLVVGDRLKTKNGCYEHLDHWRARAAIETMFQLAASSPLFAQAIEARRGKTGTGLVHESAVGPADAPISNPEDHHG